jgi:REP element-mobilizing transposase RayT
VPQSLANVLIHIVFSTKLRAPLLKKEIRQELHPYMVGIVQKNGCGPVQIGGIEDHVHLLISLSRTITIAQLVEHLKTGSSKWLKEQSPALKEFAWQAGYGVFSVHPAQAHEVIRYIHSQEAHHQKYSYQEELRSLMAEAGVEIDERYVWD